MKKRLVTLIFSMNVLFAFGQASPPQDEGWQVTFFKASDVVIPMLVDAAVRNSAEVEILAASNQIANDQLKLAKKELLTGVSLHSAYSYGSMANIWNREQLNQLNAFALDSRSMYSVGVSVGYSLEQLLGGKRLRLNQREMVVKQAEAEKRIGEREIRQKVIILYQELVLAKMSLDHAQDAMQTANVSKQMAEKQFREGNLRVEEQMAVNEMYNNAMLTQVQASNKYETALLLLEDTIGMTVNTLMNSK